MERRAVIEVEDANTPCVARQREIVMLIESCLAKEPVQDWTSSIGPQLDQLIKFASPLSRSFRLMKEGTLGFFLIEELRGEEVVDAVRFVEQARNDEEMERMGESRASQEITNKVSEDTHRKNQSWKTRLRPCASKIA